MYGGMAARMPGCCLDDVIGKGGDISEPACCFVVVSFWNVVRGRGAAALPCRGRPTAAVVPAA